MWVDGQGVLHSVALPDPTDVMTGDFLRGLDALLAAERERLSDIVEDAQMRLLAMDWSRVGSSESDVELAPPRDLLNGAVRTPDDVSDAIGRVPERWRLDAVLALGDYID